jgi:hypothetical protein
VRRDRTCDSFPCFAIALLVAVASAACLALPDPVHERAVDRLGEEDPVGPGALHRAGQPCGTCHSEAGPAQSDFSIAGTVFAAPEALAGVEGARIELVDAAGTSPPGSSPVVTNCVGNFWVRRDAWDPLFPVRVTITKGNERRAMSGTIGRTSSCADCHSTSADPFTKVRPVMLVEPADHQRRETHCPVSPIRSRP